MKGKAWFKFLFPFFLGVVFFFVPIPAGGRFTVPFDLVVTGLRKEFPSHVKTYTFFILQLGVLLSLAAPFTHRLSKFRTSLIFLLLRITGGIFALFFFLDRGPSLLTSGDTRKFMMEILLPSVAVIIPIGASVINMLTSTGTLDFVGTLARPLMRPLYRIPGRAALDILTSWVGSYSVGLYLTRNVFEKGGYSKREAFIIATCFSTVSIGFVGVVASTLNILNLFPLIFVGYFIGVFAIAAIIVRIPPTSRIPEEYIALPMPEAEARGNLLRQAVDQALLTAKESPSLAKLFIKGFWDGLLLAALILSTIASVGSIALLLANHTSLFQYLALPFVPVYKLLGMPHASELAMATVIEVAEMYLPAILVKNSPLVVKFFVAILSTSQLIFFSSVGPMIMDMFREIPVKFTHLLFLFLERTLLLIPLVWAYTTVLQKLGVL